ncbi:MAG: NPCBM/NEW2 domain-containing protein [Chthoniobacteraceae bacterium]
MKSLPCCIAVILFFHGLSFSYGQTLVLSKVDSAHADVREKTLNTWSTDEEAGALWHQMASTHISIYTQRQLGGPNHDLYIPNPGIGYWVLSNLSEQSLWRTQEEKIKIGDELVGATIYKNAKGEDQYWALWVSHDNSYLLKDRMREYGITPARVIYPPKMSLLDLPVKDSKVGNAGLWIGKNVDGRDVLLHGKPCEDYLFANAPSRVVYGIPAGVASFSAWGIGPEGDSKVTGSWSYIVKIDGKEVFRSKPLQEYAGREVPIDVQIPAGSKEMELIVDPMENGISGPSIWAEPAFKWQDRRMPTPRMEEKDKEVI